MKSLLVVPWGNPREWKEVEYVFDGSCAKSKSTLPLLLENIKPAIAIVIILDTIAESGESYSDIIDNARSFCLDFISNELGVKEQVEVIVVPGVGEFRNGIFKGKIKDFYAYVLFRLSQLFPSEDIAIHLDLTHGVNFMPALTYRAVREIAGIIAICKEVKFAVYNSEPYTRGVKSLAIHLVESSRMKPVPSFDVLSWSKRLLEPINLEAKEREKLFRYELKCRDRIDVRKLNAFLSSIVNGLPLVLYSSYPDIEELENCLKISEEVYKKYISISTNGKLLVERKLCFGDDFVACVKVYLTAKILSQSNRLEATLDELHKLRKILFLNKKLDSAISRDLYEIEERVKKAIEDGRTGEFKTWTPLSKLIEGKSEINLRNFLAHSGLERNITEIKLDLTSEIRKAIKVRYAPEKLKDVMDLASNSLIQST